MSVKIGQFGVTYAPRTTIKTQTLADFIVELTFQSRPSNSANPPWELHVNEFSPSTKAREGVTLTSPEGHSFQMAIMFLFHATNNEAEYEVLIRSLEMAIAMGVRRLQLHTDSQLIACQVSSEYEARDDRMTAYQNIIGNLLEKFEQVYVKLISRSENLQANSLARLATTEGLTNMTEVTITKLTLPSTSYSLVVTLDPMDVDEDDWMALII